jgi:ABC-type glutathione transport system ATPase component
VAGRDLTALGKRELRDARQNIGMIFQQFNLLQNASVFDNVAFPLKIHGRPSAQIAARVAECLALVGLSDKRTAIRRSCRAGRNSAWPSPARWPATRCCCATSRPRRWMRNHARPARHLRDINRAWRDHRHRQP